MKKAAIVLLFVLVLSIPCFGAEKPKFTDDNVVVLRDYFERLIYEQEKNLDTRFRYLADALKISSDVLDQRFVRVDKFMEKTAGYDSSLSELTNRMTVVETKSSVTSEMASSEAAKMAIWLGLFFTALQIVIGLFILKSKQKNGSN